MNCCKLCNAEFEQVRIGRKRKFCSDECQRQWWKENRETAKKRYVYTCLHCGKEYEAKEKNRDKYCSRECAYDDIEAWINRGELVKKLCPSCEQWSESTESGSGYCSDKCAERGMKHECKVCGAVFYGHFNARYCSDECQRKQRSDEFRTYKEAIGKNGGRVETLVCKECGAEFEHCVWNRVPEYCSKKCSRMHWKNDNPDKARAMVSKQRHIRRARKKNNGPIQSIDPVAVFRRDGWFCGVCGKKVDPLLKFPHSMSPTLDHIIPLAQGGSHTWGNVQLAHFICNSMKRDKGDGQLRLGLAI